MTWVRLDDAHQDHPKIAPLSDRAYRLWVRALAYSNRFGLDGVLTMAQIRQICGGILARKRHIDGLISAGLWQKSGDTIVIHDIADYQPAAKKAGDISKKRSEAGRKGAAARWGTDGNLPLANDAPGPARPVPARPLTIDPVKSGNGNGRGDPDRLMLGEINKRLEGEFGPRGFISAKWQPKLAAHLPYTPDELESAIMEARAADPDDANGGLVASILVRYRRQKNTPGRGRPIPAKPIKTVEPLGPDGLPRSASRVPK